MLDLRNGGQAYINWQLARTTVHGLVDKLGWQAAREATRVASDQLGLSSSQDIVKVMRLWEAYAGAVLAQQGGRLDKEESKEKRCSQATLLYRQEVHFNFLNNLAQNNYPNLDALETALESCYILGRTSDAFLQAQLAAHLAGLQGANSNQALPAVALTIAPAAAAVTPLAAVSGSQAEEKQAPGGPTEQASASLQGTASSLSL